MLANFTWTEFIVCIIFLIIIYYSYVLARYFSDELRAFFKIKFRKNESLNPLPEEVSMTTSSEILDEPKVPVDDFLIIEHLVEDLKNKIEFLVSRSTEKDEFLTSLKLVVSKYPSLKYLSHQNSIDKLILSELEKWGYYSINENDLDKIWE